MAEAETEAETDNPLNTGDVKKFLIIIGARAPVRLDADLELQAYVDRLQGELHDLSESWKRLLGRSTFRGVNASSKAAYGVSDAQTLLNAASIILALYGGLVRFALRNHVGVDPGTGEAVSLSTLSVLLDCPWFGVEMDEAAYTYAEAKYTLLIAACVPSPDEPHYLQGHYIRRLRMSMLHANTMRVSLKGFTLLYAFDGKGVSATDFKYYLQNPGRQQEQYQNKYQYLRHMFLNLKLEVACISSLTPAHWKYFQTRTDWFSSGVENRQCYENTFLCPLGRMWCVKVLHSQNFGCVSTMLNIWWRPDAVLRSYQCTAVPTVALEEASFHEQYTAMLQTREGIALFSTLPET